MLIAANGERRASSNQSTNASAVPSNARSAPAPPPPANGRMPTSPSPVSPSVEPPARSRYRTQAGTTISNGWELDNTAAMSVTVPSVAANMAPPCTPRPAPS